VFGNLLFPPDPRQPTFSQQFIQIIRSLLPIVACSEVSSVFDARSIFGAVLSALGPASHEARLAVPLRTQTRVARTVNPFAVLNSQIRHCKLSEARRQQSSGAFSIEVGVGIRSLLVLVFRRGKHPDKVLVRASSMFS
jgi:hypothetical protein